MKRFIIAYIGKQKTKRAKLFIYLVCTHLIFGWLQPNNASVFTVWIYMWTNGLDELYLLLLSLSLNRGGYIFYFFFFFFTVLVNWWCGWEQCAHGISTHTNAIPIERAKERERDVALCKVSNTLTCAWIIADVRPLITFTRYTQVSKRVYKRSACENLNCCWPSCPVTPSSKNHFILLLRIYIHLTILRSCIISFLLYYT